MKASRPWPLSTEKLAFLFWWNFGLTGEGIYFYRVATNAIEFISFAAQKTTQIARPEKGVRTFAVSPDRRSILFSRRDLDTSNLMLVENFCW